MNLNYPAPSSVWETGYSLRPTVPCECHHVSISWRRKRFAGRAANGSAVMSMGAHIQMSMARTIGFLCRGAYSITEVLAQICELQDIGKYFQDELAKEQTLLGMLGLLRDLNFLLKIYQDQQQKPTVPHSKVVARRR